MAGLLIRFAVTKPWVAKTMKLLHLNVFLAAGALVGALAVSTPAQAYTVKGMGKCSTWVGGTDDRFWLLGFISGNNFATNGTVGKDVNADDIYRWVNRYCTQRPDDDLADAITQFIKLN